MHDQNLPSAFLTYTHEPINPSVLVWLWGPHHDMARAEVAAVTGAPATLLGPGLAAATTDDWKVLQRLGHGRAVLRYLGRSADPIPPFDPGGVIHGTFAARVQRLGVAATVSELEVARHLWRRLRQPRVDLQQPDTEIDVFVTPTGLWWGELLHTFDGGVFDARSPRRRPFWRSIALPPRRARCLVNLSGVRPGGTLLDPFCGTGSIVIEAALLGVRAQGSDLDGEVFAGAVRNLAALGLEADLHHRDARSWSRGAVRFDAIVSDLPYGHTASLQGSDRLELYRSFLRVAAEILDERGRMVLMVKKGTLPEPTPGLEVVERFYEVVHASLTREVVVLQKGRSKG